jgi:hypothetical protein
MKITTETIGLVVSVIAVLPFFMGGIMNLTKNPTAIKNIEHIGYPPGFLNAFGISVILIGALTLVPSTSFLGVILATGWMGGAIAAHVRVRDNFILQTIIPILIWIGFGLRHQAELHRLFGF